MTDKTASQVLTDIENQIKDIESKNEQLLEMLQSICDKRDDLLKQSQDEQQKIDVVESDINSNFAKIESLKEKLTIADLVRKEIATEIASTKNLQRDAFNTLYAKASAGTATASEVVELGKVLGFPDPLEPNDEFAEEC